MREGYYYWNVTIPASTSYNLTWCARLSYEAGLWSGSSLHVRVLDGGSKDIPISKPDIIQDLYATKSATVICNAINYTITYGNEGDKNQTNTVLSGRL